MSGNRPRVTVEQGENRPVDDASLWTNDYNTSLFGYKMGGTKTCSKEKQTVLRYLYLLSFLSKRDVPHLRWRSQSCPGMSQVDQAVAIRQQRSFQKIWGGGELAEALPSGYLARE